MPTLLPRLKKTALATAVAAAAVSGLSVLPAHADAPATQRAPHQMAITLDHVALKVTSPDVPTGKPYVAAPGAGVQVASVSDLKPVYQYLSVTAVPFGQTLPQSVYPFPASKAGDTTAWTRALHGTQNGPVATIFGQKVRGTVVHSHGSLTGKKGDDTDIQAIEWIVNAGGRTWVFNLQHDQDKLPNGFGTGLVITAADVNAHTTVDPTKTHPAKAPTTRFHANDVALGGYLGQPSWWNSTCDGNGSELSSSRTFMGLEVCTNGGNATDAVPGVSQLEWQCADLSDRYLVQRYGLSGPGGNGSQEADHWHNAYPSKFQLHSNGDGTVPVAGDVISFATGSGNFGHTGVVYQSNVDSNGNGTVYFVDQNWTGDGGYNSASVSNGYVTEVTGEGGSVQWLHNPNDSAAPAPTISVTGPSSGQIVSGQVSLGASTTGSPTSVTYYVDGTAVGTVSGGNPFGFTLNTNALPDGPHTITAQAANSTGTTTSAAIPLDVANNAVATTTTGDFNGDGKDDLAVFYDLGTTSGGAHETALYVFTADSNGDGGFAAPIKVWDSATAGGSWNAKNIKAVALNLNGKEGIAVLYNEGVASNGQNETALFEFLGNGDGTFQNPIQEWDNISLNEGSFDWHKTKITAGNFHGNSNGVQDVALLYNEGSNGTGGNNTAVWEFANRGGGGFGSPTKVWDSATTGGSFTWDNAKLTAGDFNSDGKDDLAVLYNEGLASNGQNETALFTFTADSNGDGGFAGPVQRWDNIAAGGGSWNWDRSKVTALNLNGKQGVAVLYNEGVTSSGANETALFEFLGNGDGTFQNPIQEWDNISLNEGSFSWNNSKIVAGNFHGNANHVQDIAVLYNEGPNGTGGNNTAVWEFANRGGGGYGTPAKVWDSATAGGSWTWDNSTIG
jgi:hypothetical protein